MGLEQEGDVMTTPAGTPRQMLEALHSRDRLAREQLCCWLNDLVARLMDHLIAQHRLPYKRELLTHQALHSVEIYLRTRDPSDVDTLSWAAFRSMILVYLAKMAFLPLNGTSVELFRPGTLPVCSG